MICTHLLQFNKGDPGMGFILGAGWCAVYLKMSGNPQVFSAQPFDWKQDIHKHLHLKNSVVCRENQEATVITDKVLQSSTMTPGSEFWLRIGANPHGCFLNPVICGEGRSVSLTGLTQEPC
tara:strand:- start:44 stop:406 length:363 start_codon:yes stop_codon:yes gene_type:complete